MPNYLSLNMFRPPFTLSKRKVFDKFNRKTLDMEPVSNLNLTKSFFLLSLLHILLYAAAHLPFMLLYP